MNKTFIQPNIEIIKINNNCIIHSSISYDKFGNDDEDSRQIQKREIFDEDM